MYRRLSSWWWMSDSVRVSWTQKTSRPGRKCLRIGTPAWWSGIAARLFRGSNLLWIWWDLELSLTTTQKVDFCGDMDFVAVVSWMSGVSLTLFSTQKKWLDNVPTQPRIVLSRGQQNSHTFLGLGFPCDIGILREHRTTRGSRAVGGTPGASRASGSTSAEL